jgi:hypothetical protein
VRRDRWLVGASATLRGVRPRRLLRHVTVTARHRPQRREREDWFWDYSTQQMYDGPELAGPANHPDDQPTPGPAGRVPSDWQNHIH